MKESKLKFIFDHIEEIVLAPGFAIMLTINFANVLSRFVLHNSWAFTEELCTMMFVYISFFGAAVAAKRRQHLGFTMILEKLPPLWCIAMNTLILICVLAFLAVMIRFGMIVCMNQLASGATSAALRIPTAWGSVCIPIGGIFIAIRVLQVYVEDVRKLVSEIHPSKGA